jgi:creatinine amidohydrolase
MSSRDIAVAFDQPNQITQETLMGVFSSHLEREVRMEHMRPAQIDAAMAQRPAVYIAFGSLEWHGRQNPIGLDATKAHEFLVGLASRVGGVVHPALFFSSGGGHSDYPHSFMYPPEAMRGLLTHLLHRLERDGFRAAILLSGHYPNKTEFMDPAVEAFRAGGGAMEILSIVENEAPGVGGDHAAHFETSYQMFLHPETVDLGELAGGPVGEETGGPDQRTNWMLDGYEEHPCYGIVGADPRKHASTELGREATERLIVHLGEWLDGK